MKSVRILHVTEIMEGGIADFLASITEKQLEVSAEVYIFFPQLKKPIHAGEFLSGFKRYSTVPVNHSFIRPIKIIKRLFRTMSLLFRLNRCLSNYNFDIVHLHSSFAGLGRFPGIVKGEEISIVFSPHGLSFLQSNHSSRITRVFLAVERYLAGQANLFICTSQSEADVVTERLVPRNNVEVVRNGIRDDLMSKAPREFPESRFRIAMMGRITYQKAPWVFNEIAAACKEFADFTWIGSEPGAPLKWLDEQNVQVLPWLTKEKLVEQMDSVDLLVHPTLWEGFPLIVALAQGRGVPVLVSDVIGNLDAIAPGYSGFVCTSIDDYVSKIKQVVISPSLYKNLSNGALAYAHEFLSNRHLGSQTIALYEQYMKIKKNAS